MAVKGHTFKLEETTWLAFVAKVQSRGRSASSVINACIHLYLDEQEPTNADELDKAVDTYGTAGRPGPKGPRTAIEE